MINIIGGRYKKTKLLVPKKEVRPTSSLKREAIFSILESYAIKNSYNLYKNKCFIDLFAGSGALGLEAISRGAEFCFFYEKNIDVLKILDANCKKICNNANYQIINKDLNNTNLFNTKIPISGIFIDPPYEMTKFDYLLNKIKDLSDLHPHTFIIIESNKKNKLDNLKGYHIYKEKIFGITKISLLKLN